MSIIETAFFDEKANLTYKEGDVTKQFKSTDEGLLITKSEDVSAYLALAKKEREQFKLSSNTQDHMTKVASIPRIVYDDIMNQADLRGITSIKDRQKFLLEVIQTKEFEAFLTIPKHMIRK